MSFINRNKQEFNFSLTAKGKEILLKEGWDKLNLYCKLSDTTLNYNLQVKPDLIVDYSGSEKGKIITITQDGYFLT